MKSQRAQVEVVLTYCRIVVLAIGLCGRNLCAQLLEQEEVCPLPPKKRKRLALCRSACLLTAFRSNYCWDQVETESLAELHARSTRPEVYVVHVVTASWSD